MTATVQPARLPSLTSQRDRDVLRSFAQRIDPTDAGGINLTPHAILLEGALHGKAAAIRKIRELGIKGF